MTTDLAELHDAPAALRNLADADERGTLVGLYEHGSVDRLGRDDLRRWADAIEALLAAEIDEDD